MQHLHFSLIKLANSSEQQCHHHHHHMMIWPKHIWFGAIDGVTSLLFMFSTKNPVHLVLLLNSPDWFTCLWLICMGWIVPVSMHHQQVEGDFTSSCLFVLHTFLHQSPQWQMKASFLANSSLIAILLHSWEKIQLKQAAQWKFGDSNEKRQKAKEGIIGRAPWKEDSSVKQENFKQQFNATFDEQNFDTTLGAKLCSVVFWKRLWSNGCFCEMSSKLVGCQFVASHINATNEKNESWQGVMSLVNSDLRLKHLECLAKQRCCHLWKRRTDSSPCCNVFPCCNHPIVQETWQGQQVVHHKR